MKALSLRQPWAAAVLKLGKRIENRRWNTKFRGDFLVHAAKGMTAVEHSDARDFCQDVLGIAKAFDIDEAIGADGSEARERVTFGGFVGVARLVDVVLPRPEYMPGGVEAHYPPALREDGWRWHMREQFGFVLEGIRAFPTLIPYAGSLGFFEVPLSIVALALDLSEAVRGVIATMRPVAPVSEWFRNSRARPPTTPAPVREQVARMLRPAIPPPPRVPVEAHELLAKALTDPAPEPEPFGSLDHLFDDLPPVDLPIPFSLPELDEPIQFDLVEAPSVPEDVHELRVQELLIDGNVLLEEARSARRERDRARFESDAWHSRAMQLEATARRMDPAWRNA